MIGWEAETKQLMERNMFVALSDTPVALTGSDVDRALLAIIRASFGRWYTVHECTFDRRAPYGRGTALNLEWREPATTFAHALVVAPLCSFRYDVQFELRRSPMVFPIPAVILQRRTSPRCILDVGNITVVSEAPVHTRVWQHANRERAVRLINSFLADFGLPHSDVL